MKIVELPHIIKWYDITFLKAADVMVCRPIAVSGQTHPLLAVDMSRNPGRHTSETVGSQAVTRYLSREFSSCRAVSHPRLMIYWASSTRLAMVMHAFA